MHVRAPIPFKELTRNNGCICTVHKVNRFVLRAHPSENHVLNYESELTPSDFVQILCRVT